MPMGKAKPTRYPRTMTLASVWVMTTIAMLVVACGSRSSLNARAAPGGQNDTLYVSASGSDSGSCSQSAPCLSFGRAYQLASPGDTVLVAAGRYGLQTIRYQDAKTVAATCREGVTFGDGSVTAQNLSGCITFQAQGAVTVSGPVVVQAPYVRIVGVTADAMNVGYGVDGVGGACSAMNTTDDVFESDTASDLFVYGARYLYVMGGSYGGTNPGVSSVVSACNDGVGSFHTSHVALSGVTFHDVVQTAAGQHMECLHWFDGNASVIQGSRFLNCAQIDLSIEPDNSMINAALADHLLVQNNVFANVCSGQTLDTAGGSARA